MKNEAYLTDGKTYVDHWNGEKWEPLSDDQQQALLRRIARKEIALLWRGSGRVAEFYLPPLPKEVRYPDVHVSLTGGDGNAYAIIVRAKRAMRREGIHPAMIEAFRDEAMSGDYDHLIRTCMAWVTVE